MSNPYLPTITDLGGTIKKVRRLVDPEVKEWSAFNPSIATDSEGNLYMTIRSSNYVVEDKTNKYVLTIGAKVKNRLWFCELDEDLEIKNLREIKFSEIPYQDMNVSLIRGAEDARLYWRNGSLEFVAVLKENEIPIPRVARFSLKNDRAELLEIFGYEGQSQKVAEKNWMVPYKENENFDAVIFPHQVVKYRELKTLRDLNEKIEKIRGGSNLWDLGDSTYLSIVHETHITNKTFYDSTSFGYVKAKVRDYLHRFARYDYSGKLIQISEPFRFKDKGIEFASGLVIIKNEVVISLGIKDVSSWIAKIDINKVFEMLEDV